MTVSTLWTVEELLSFSFFSFFPIEHDSLISFFFSNFPCLQGPSCQFGNCKVRNRFAMQVKFWTILKRCARVNESPGVSMLEWICAIENAQDSDIALSIFAPLRSFCLAFWKVHKRLVLTLRLGFRSRGADAWLVGTAVPHRAWPSPGNRAVPSQKTCQTTRRVEILESYELLIWSWRCWVLSFAFWV